MICEREAEIEAFVPREYWTIDAQGEHTAQSFPLKLVEFHGRKVEQFSFTDETGARKAEQSLRSAAGPQGALTVHQVDRKQRRRNPAPPFTTSTLQQEASRKLGFSAQRTMRLAQQLYEGVDIGEGSVGLITYMRTDSVSLAADAVQEIRAVIERLYGKEAVADEVRVYQHQVEERSGSARSDPPDLGGHRTGRASRANSIPISTSCTRSSGSAPSPARWRMPCTTPWRWTCWPAATARSAICCAPTARR